MLDINVTVAPLAGAPNLLIGLILKYLFLFSTFALYKAKIDKQTKYLRIKPINKFGAPARGATVTLLSNQRKHSKTIDSGSGYLCQMEPVAHYGIRKNEKDFRVEVKWTNGSKDIIKINSLNQTIIVKQK